MFYFKTVYFMPFALQPEAKYITHWSFRIMFYLYGCRTRITLVVAAVSLDPAPSTQCTFHIQLTIKRFMIFSGNLSLLIFPICSNNKTYGPIVFRRSTLSEFRGISSHQNTDRIFLISSKYNHHTVQQLWIPHGSINRITKSIQYSNIFILHTETWLSRIINTI